MRISDWSSDVCSSDLTIDRENDERLGREDRMKFYNSVGPNPRVVKLFMAEKGIEIPEVSVDLRGGENRRAPYNVDVNPAGQTPALELDDGSILSRSEERRVGKACVSTCRSRWSPNH